MAGTPPVIILTGPTACGKSALALELAREFPLEVISADSMQVYAHMDIATAKPTAEERACLPHHLIDVLPPDEEFTAGRFAGLAHEKMAEVRGRGAVPLIVGGTGLYIKALLFGLCPAPTRDERLRGTLKQLEADTPGSLWKHLRRLDPATAAKVTPRDTARLVRFLEMIYLSGHKPSHMHAGHGFAAPRLEHQLLCIDIERDTLYARINERVLRMFALGLIEETRKLLDLGFSRNLKSMSTLAYKHVISFLDGACSQDEAITLIQRDTRHYAKRQITWNRGHYQPHEQLSMQRAYDLLKRAVQCSLERTEE